MPEMNEIAKSFQAEIDSYTEKVKAGQREVPLSKEQIRQIEKKLAESGYQNEAFRLACDGNYSQIEAVPPLLKNYLGTKKVNEFLEQYGSDVSKPEVQQFLRDNALDGAFRAGLSIARHQGTILARELQECERFLNRHVMEKTLGPVNRVAKAEIEAAPNGANLLNMNLEKRVMMAKILLMCQIGRFDEKREDGKTKPYEDTVAEAFSHGGRTKFALPYGGNQKAVLGAVMGDAAHPAGLDSRSAATHYVSAQKVDANGNTVSEMKEERPKANPFKIMSKQYGMNVAVGGMGEMGPHKERIMADGRNGHMYMRAEKGGERTCGSLLVGFENSGPGKKSRIGSSHGASAKSAGQSAFMADKGVPGAVIDGRTVDLSGIDPATFQQFMAAFTEKYRALLSDAESYSGPTWMASRQKLEEFNRLLSGEQAESLKLKLILAGLGIGLDRNLVERVVNAGRGRQPMKAYDLGIEKVQPVSDESAERWNEDLTEKLSNQLHLDLSKPEQMDRLQVMENCGGEWKLRPLFDAQKHATPQARYNRFRTLVNEGKEIYAYGAGELLPRKLELNKETLETAVSGQISVMAPVVPEKPKGYKRFLHTISFGLIYKQTMKNYEKAKQAYGLERQKHTALENKRQERTAGPALQEVQSLREATASGERSRSKSVSIPSPQKDMAAAQRSRSNSISHKPAKSGPVK